MKRITYWLSLFTISVSLVLAAMSPLVQADNQNLIQNSDLSIIDPSTQLPTNWQTDSWGTNQPTFSFIKATATNSSYLRVDLQNYSDGDAKWAFDRVTVKPGDSYQYTDNYLSNVVTNIWAQYLDSAGSPTYVWLGNDQASSSFKSTTFKFTAPANAASATIFHVINADGYLQTNNFSLIDTTTTPPVCQPTLTNGIYNSSLEETCSDNPSAPAWWYSAIYGSATATFDYLNSPHSGNKSVDINVTSDSGGEAGWYFKPVPVSPNQRYQFSYWYDSTIYDYAYAEITLADGSLSYISLMSAPASGSVWSHYQDEFITPSNARSLTIHTATSDVGQVILDDFALQPLSNYTSNSFNQPIVSIDFDDGWSSQYVNGLPVINQLGIKSTFYINYGNLGGSGYMTTAQVKKLASNYYEEIGSHAYYHDDLVTLPLASAQDEISSNNAALKDLTGQTIYDFATPYGSYNTPILDYIMQFHQTQRDTSGQLNYKYNFNPRIIHSVLITKETTLTQINNLLNQARANGAWLIFTYHRIASGGDDYTITKTTLQKQLQAIKNSGISIETTHQAYTEIAPQL